MLQIVIPAVEQWDELNEEFIRTKEQKLVLEHSLVSLSKWESKWCKPFLSKQERTHEEIIDYVRCMTITQNVNSQIYELMTLIRVCNIKSQPPKKRSRKEMMNRNTVLNAARRKRLNSKG